MGSGASALSSSTSSTSSNPNNHPTNLDHDHDDGHGLGHGHGHTHAVQRIVKDLTLKFTPPTQTAVLSDTLIVRNLKSLTSPQLHLHEHDSIDPLEPLASDALSALDSSLFNSNLELQSQLDVQSITSLSASYILNRTTSLRNTVNFQSQTRSIRSSVRAINSARNSDNYSATSSNTSTFNTNTGIGLIAPVSSYGGDTEKNDTDKNDTDTNYINELADLLPPSRLNFYLNHNDDDNDENDDNEGDGNAAVNDGDDDGEYELDQFENNSDLDDEEGEGDDIPHELNDLSLLSDSYGTSFGSSNNSNSNSNSNNRDDLPVKKQSKVKAKVKGGDDGKKQRFKGANGAFKFDALQLSSTSTSNSSVLNITNDKEYSNKEYSNKEFSNKHTHLNLKLQLDNSFSLTSTSSINIVNQGEGGNSSNKYKFTPKPLHFTTPNGTKLKITTSGIQTTSNVKLSNLNPTNIHLITSVGSGASSVVYKSLLLNTTMDGISMDNDNPNGDIDMMLVAVKQVGCYSGEMEAMVCCEVGVLVDCGVLHDDNGDGDDDNGDGDGNDGINKADHTGNNSTGKNNIIKFYDAYLSECGNKVNVVLEYMTCSLSSLLIPSSSLQSQSHSPLGTSSLLSLSVIKQITKSVTLGLNYIHKKNLLHRDIKPGNILISLSTPITNKSSSSSRSRSSSGNIKISDFGISRSLQDSRALAETSIGTYLYMSPQTLLGEVYGRKCDVWSLGVLLVTLAIGRFPVPVQGDGESGGVGFWDIHALIVPPSFSNKVFSGLNEAKAWECGFVTILEEHYRKHGGMNSERWCFVGFVKRCLIFDDVDRADTDELTKHVFLRDNVNVHEDVVGGSGDNGSVNNNTNSKNVHVKEITEAKIAEIIEIKNALKALNEQTNERSGDDDDIDKDNNYDFAVIAGQLGVSVEDVDMVIRCK